MNQELNEELIEVCVLGYLGLVKKLVNNGADIHYRNEFTYTPFKKASQYGHLEIIKWLYEQGADPTTDNNLAIRWASCSGHLEVVKYLYSIRCDPHVYNNEAIQLASWNGHLEVVKYLAFIGCDTNVIENLEHRKIAEDYVKYKKLFKNCLNEIYGNPRLERTRTENEISFREYQN